MNNFLRDIKRLDIIDKMSLDKVKEKIKMATTSEDWIEVEKSNKVECVCRECGKTFYHDYYKISICEECHKKVFKGYRPSNIDKKIELIVTPWSVKGKQEEEEK